ncbi:MAG: GldG family protein, partial [Oscillospiraceae bacterium]|nr:GldG family protein [Oscillospiraceae bacterium]
ESMVEKVLTTSLLRVTADLAPVVLFTGHGEDTDVAAGLVRTFGNNGYEAVPHDITTAAEIPPEAVTAVILAPQVDFNESEIIRLRDWLRNDGMWNRNLILFASPWDDCPLLFEFIGEEYNLEITSDLIVETKAGNIYNNSAFFSFGTVTDTEFTARIAGQRALSPLPRRIIPKRAYDPEANFYTVSLVDYGETARTFVNSIDIESYDIMDSTVKAEAYPISAMAYAHKRQQARDIDALVDTYVMVVGAEEFLNPNITANIKTAANETLFMSVFNAISGNTTGAIITSRMINNPSIQLDAASASWLSILFVGVLPIGTLAAGLVVFLRRRHL